MLQSITVSWDGADIFFERSAGPSEWTQFTFKDLVATGNSTVLSFSGRNDPTYFLLDDISVREAMGAGRDRTRALVEQARELAERLSRMVDRLDDDDAAEGLRRMAAYLHAHLAVLERDWSTLTVH